jgi:hypothetical protein
VKDIFVHLPTLATVRAIDKDLCKKLRKDFPHKKETERLVAIMLALKGLGRLPSIDRGDETWFFIDPKENLADDVIRIKLKEQEWERAIELSKCIAPTLEGVWRRVDEIDGHQKNSQFYEFELDPFISDLARLIDIEITAQRPEFKVVDLAERIAQICLELLENDVARKVGTGSVPEWATAVAIDLRIGGAKISHNARFAISSKTNTTILVQFQKAIKQHLKRRLASMLETEETLFQLYYMGKIKIATIDSHGHYCWEIADNKRHAGANARRKVRKTVL